MTTGQSVPGPTSFQRVRCGVFLFVGKSYSYVTSRGLIGNLQRSCATCFTPSLFVPRMLWHLDVHSAPCCHLRFPLVCSLCVQHGSQCLLTTAYWNITKTNSLLWYWRQAMYRLFRVSPDIDPWWLLDDFLNFVRQVCDIGAVNIYVLILWILERKAQHRRKYVIDITQTTTYSLKDIKICSCNM